MKLFGTDGVRGPAGSFLTAELAYKLGLYATHRLKKQYENPQILIGTDTRISCDMLKAAISSGIMSAGGTVIDAGVLPTPAVAFLVKQNKYAAGVVISASHNAFYDNGIKFFNSAGHKLADEIEQEIEKLITENTSITNLTHEKIGIIKEGNECSDYISFVRSKLISNKKLKVAIDTANGATYKHAYEIFSDFFDVSIINNEPNGININDNCGSTYMEPLRRYVLENKLDLGIAFDGDGDRMLAVDSNGNLINGDELMLIFSTYLYKKGTLAKNTLVSTIMSNSALHESLLEKGISTVKTKVGDRYVLEEMLKNGYSLGGEDSGHIIFLDEATTGDGLLSAAMLLSIISEKGSLDELNTLVRYPQITIAAPADDDKKQNFETKELLQKIDELKQKHSAVTVRASGTEPVIRITIEGKDKEEIMNDTQIIRSMIC
ncbi:MAG: phosphoglucosamine mutase [Defluviitaleaceae bacterium]|nr:phosphoglucosamine mutase [Defluviitaleaceae bacterium]